MDKKIKVLLIDPWGINASGEYLNGLIYGLSKYVELTVFTNVHFELKTDAKCKIYKLFFKKSEGMKVGRKRKIIRGLEYILSYHKILKYLRKKEKYDIIHINWLLMYKVDIYILLLLKKHCNKLVYTAHNVLPHINGDRYIKSLGKIYHIVDKIVLHGEGIKKEFLTIFPRYGEKVYVQKHGADLFPSTAFNLENIPLIVQEKLKKYKSKSLYIGYMYFNKGVDRLISMWRKMPTDSLLIIAGKINSNYEELENQRDVIERTDNILFIDRFIPDEMANYLLSQSDLILLPYRHASMSGVVFTAADFSKPVWATDVGAIKEYLDKENDFIVENDEDKMLYSLQKILQNLSTNEMQKRGAAHNKYIKKFCSWDCIMQKLYDECYL